jgi:hypothetical protein
MEGGDGKPRVEAWTDGWMGGWMGGGWKLVSWQNLQIREKIFNHKEEDHKNIHNVLLIAYIHWEFTTISAYRR